MENPDYSFCSINNCWAYVYGMTKQNEGTENQRDTKEMATMFNSMLYT